MATKSTNARASLANCALPERSSRTLLREAVKALMQEVQEQVQATSINDLRESTAQLIEDMRGDAFALLDTVGTKELQTPAA